MAQRLLLTDSASPLGSAILGMLERESYPVLCPSANDVDWLDKAAVVAYFASNKPDIVINTLGWADRGANLNLETYPRWTENLVHAARQRDVIFIHLSSYRVFNGEKSEFAELDTPAPISPSGDAYWAAEQRVAQLPRHIILRLSWVIGWAGENLLTRLLTPLAAGAQAGIYGERRGAPTALDDVARVLVGVLKQVLCGADNWGVFHYCSSDVATEDEFAQQVIQILRDYVPEPGSVVLLDEVDPQPQSAALSCRRIHDNFGVQPRTWRKGLSMTIKKWLSEQGLISDAAQL